MTTMKLYCYRWFLKRLGPYNNFQKVLELKSERVTIGRTKYATFRIQSKHLSRIPCVLEFVEDHWTLVENGGNAVIYVNNYKVLKGDNFRLAAGDKIGFGVPVFLQTDESNAIYELCKVVAHEEDHLSINAFHWPYSNRRISEELEESILHEKTNEKVVLRMCINLCTSDEEDEDEKDEVNRPKFRRKRIHSVNSSVDGQLTKPQGLLYCESRSNPLIQDSHDIVRTHQSSGVIAETAEGLVESNDIVEVVPSNNIIIERVVTSEKLPLLNETEIRYVGNEKFDEKQNEKFMLHVLHEESLVTKSDQFVTENIDNANFLVEDQSITNESFKSDVTPVSDIKSLKGLNFEEIKDKNVTLEEFFVAQQSSDVKCGLNRCGSDSDIFTILGHSSDATQPRNPNASKYKSRNELGNERSQRREKRKLSHGGQPPKSNLSPLKKVKSSRMPSGEKDDSFSAKTCEVLSSPEHLGTPIIKMIADDHGKSAEKSQLSEMSQFQYKDNDKHSEGSKQGGIKLQSDISSSDKQNPIYVYDRLKNRCGNLLPSSIKSIRITDPRPLTIRRGSTCDPIQVSQPVALPKKSCQPPMVIAPKRVGGRRKSAKDSLKAKMKHKMGHRIPIPGGGSDVRINPTSPTKHCTSTFSK